jgi:RHS repeat-associated protein
MYVLDANKGIVVTPGTADNEFSNWAMDLRMQVSGASVTSYSWDLTNAPDATGASGTSTYNLTFTWANFTGSARTDTIIAKQTPSGGTQVTQTLTFTVASTSSPAYVSTPPTNYGNWANPLSPDALNIMQQTVEGGPNASLGLTEGDVQTSHALPAYNPGVASLGLVYSSVAADARPIFITHFQIDPSQAVPPTVKAQLTFNGVPGTTVWYTTSSLNPGDIMEIPLQGDATALATGRYSWSIAVTANYGTPVTTTYSGNVDIVNSSGSPFGAGWTLNNLQRIWPVTGGVILEEPGGLSLWFANGQPAGSFVRPAGDFSTLTQNTQTNVYTRTMPDGTKINFDSTGKQTSIVDRVGNTTSFGYNGSNLLVTITDPYNLITTLTYNASNKVSTIQDPALRTTTLAYDVNNVKLTSVTDPDSALWQYGYDSASRLTILTDPRSNITTFAFGSTSERIATVTRADLTTESLTAVQVQGIPAAGTGTQASPATPVLAAGAISAYTDPRNNIWNTNLDWLGFGEPSQQTDPLSDLANTYRDANGLPWLAADPLARRTRSFFDSLANPTKTVFADDTYKQATYNGFSEPLTQTDELGKTTTMSYDTSGNLLTVTQPPPATGGTSPVTTYTYDSHGFVLTAIDPNSHTTSYGYDSRDRLTSQTDALNHTATMSYDSASNMTGRTDENGHVVTYSFDSDNRLLTQTLPGTPVSTTTFGYDSIGNLTSVADPLTHTTTNTYDMLNRLKTVTDPLSHTITYGYDNNGNRITVTDPLSRITTYTFDSANRMTAVTDPLLHTTTYGYDLASELTTVTDPLSHTTTYAYSIRGFLLTKTDPLGNTITYGYNSSGDRTNNTWSAQGTITHETTTTTYDNLRRVISYSDALSVVTTYGYDSVGNLTTLTGPGSGNVITYTYDADNRLISITDQLSHTTTYGYDNVGNRVTVTDGLSRTTTSAYDAQNRLVTVTDPLLGVTTYAYDVASRQTSITDSVGNTTTYSYDNANRLINVTDPNLHLTTYVYDNANQLTSKTDRNGRQVTYSYDNAGRKTGETWVSGSYVATFTYDNANRLTVEQDTFSKYTLGYDNANRLTSVDNLGTPNAPRLTLTYTLDIFGNHTTIAGNVGGSIINTYDLDNHLTFTTNTLGLHGAKVTLTYDSRNRLSSISRGQPTISTNPNTTFGYDNADRLTGITHTNSLGATLAVLTYGYDAANQLTSYNGPEGNLTYTYDVDGQLTNVGGARIETYAYDKEGNRTMSGYTTGTGNRLTADGTYTYSYDNEGNMVGRTKTSTGEVTTFTYDFRNRLTEVLIKTSGGVTLQDDKFTYDIENRRIGKNTLSGGQSWTGYDGVNPFADFNSSGSLTFSYLYGNGIDFLLARLNTSFDPTWYLTDKLGSVRLVVNTSGNVLDSITYDSYGNIKSETIPANGDRFKFTGREWDSEIGQYFYRARNYNPGVGRFLSEDPLTSVGGDSNYYRYVLNQPTRSGDPMGLFVPPVGPIILPPPWQLPGFGQQMMARGQASIVWNRFYMPAPTIPAPWTWDRAELAAYEWSNYVTYGTTRNVYLHFGQQYAAKYEYWMTIDYQMAMIAQQRMRAETQWLMQQQQWQARYWGYFRYGNEWVNDHPEVQYCMTICAAEMGETAPPSGFLPPGGTGKFEVPPERRMVGVPPVLEPGVGHIVVDPQGKPHILPPFDTVPPPHGNNGIGWQIVPSDWPEVRPGNVPPGG